MVSVNRSANGCGVGHAGSCGVRRVERLHRPRARKPVAPSPTRFFLSCREARQTKRPPAGDWLAGGAMLLAAASWGVLAALIGG